MTGLEDSPGSRTFEVANPLGLGEASTELATAGEAEPTEPYDRRRDQPIEVVAALRHLPLDPPGRDGSLGRLAHYEIMGVVGQGAMGVVLRAYDTQLTRRVAIKVMSPALIASEEAVERFVREARAAAGINHPNVVTIHSVSEHQGIPFLVMEYVEGRSLMDRIRSGPPLGRLDLLRISVQVAGGLEAAHRQGVIHRDIKPANIMLEDKIDRVKITDFGLARVLLDHSELTSQGVVVGTPAYMSPEQVDGLVLDQRSDLFSLGCVMYAMAAGHSPFRGANALVSARRIADLEHVPLGDLDKGVPAYFARAVDRLLAKDPAARYQSAQEVVDELTVHLAKVNRGDDPDGDLPEPPADSPRLPGWFVPVVVLALALAVVAALVALRNGEAAKTRARDATIPRPRHPILKVSRGAGADFATIGDAIKHAGPDHEIWVMDPGVFDEPIPVIRGGGLDGLRLVAKGAAILRGPRIRPVLRIEGTRRVLISGFRIEAQANQHAIELTGDCAGSRIENCELVSPAESGVAVVYLHGGASGTTDTPIHLNNLRIRGGGVGLVLGGEDEQEPVSHVEVSDSEIRAASRSYGMGVVIQFANREIAFRRNVIATALAAFSLKFPDAGQASGVAIAGNSIGDVRNAFAMDVREFEQDVDVSENLIVDAESLFFGSDGIEPFADWFRRNWWERKPGPDPRLQDHFDPPGEPLEFLNRDPDRPRYLMPREGHRMPWPGRYPTAPGMPGGPRRG